MIIMSEILNRRFDTPEECLEAEQKYKEKMALKEAEKAKDTEAVKQLVLAAAAAVKAADDAVDKASEALFAHCEKYEEGGEINLNCPDEDVDVVRRTIAMISNLCDKKKLKRHHMA